MPDQSGRQPLIFAPVVVIFVALFFGFIGHHTLVAMARSLPKPPPAPEPPWFSTTDPQATSNPDLPDILFTVFRSEIVGRSGENHVFLSVDQLRDPPSTVMWGFRNAPFVAPFSQAEIHERRYRHCTTKRQGIALYIDRLQWLDEDKVIVHFARYEGAYKVHVSRVNGLWTVVSRKQISISCW